jgi:D-arabinono-1,4-lactone oxidase
MRNAGTDTIRVGKASDTSRGSPGLTSSVLSLHHHCCPTTLSGSTSRQRRGHGKTLHRQFEAFLSKATCLLYTQDHTSTKMASPVLPLSMPAAFASELAKLDPEVPFRASPAHMHHTWARTFHSRPELYIRPQSIPEIQKIVTLARRMRRRVVTVGSGHSPSDLTCTSAWMVNLDDFGAILDVDTQRKRITVQAGIRMHDMNITAKDHGLTMPSLGSIDVQSLAGAIGTATHGSSMEHGLLSDSVCSLRIVLANGQVVKCSSSQSPDLFRAALVSLGALGIIVEIEFQLVEHRDIEWTQTILPIDDIFANWDSNLWTSDEFVRVWWLPYMKRAIVWRASATTKPQRAAAYNWYGGSVGYHTYHILLWISQYVPSFLPWVEWFVFGMQYGFKNTTTTSAVEEQRTGLLMNCLYSQVVNEWSIPIADGPEALARLTLWIHGDEQGSGIPFSPKGVYVHSPIEVRIANTVGREPRPYMDTSHADTPSLYLNATLYRPYGQEPPCHERYYEAFEYLMKEYNGRPHWAKNFKDVDYAYLSSVYGSDLDDFLSVRDEVDPEGMFTGAWHRRTILPPKSEFPLLPLEEKEVVRRVRKTGGADWVGEQARWFDGGVDVFTKKEESDSEESYDLMAGAEASLLLESVKDETETESDEEEEPKRRTVSETHPELEQRVREGPDGRQGGENVFDKM